MSKLRAAFREYLEETYQHYYVQFLKEQEWLNPETDGPWIEKIVTLLQPYLGQETQIREENLELVLLYSTRAGITAELLGHLSAAMDWYRMGQYQYYYSKPFRTIGYHKVNGVLIPVEIRYIDGLPEPIHRETCAGSQLESAICATRVGNYDRARQLYEWAAQNYGFSEREIRILEGGEDKTDIVLWTNLSYRAYALLCLGRWAEALSTAEQGEAYFRRDRHWKDKTYLPIVLYPIVQAVARYKLTPSLENRHKAIEMLSPQAAASRNHVGHLWALFYLYNLRALHPDLAQPQPDELPLEERARQGAELCVKWMAEGGLMLDGTPESLKLLDETMRVVFQSLDSEEKRKQALFAWGSYFGEVVRKELAGGQWRAHGKTMTEIAVDWELGEAELHLWAYRHVKAYVTGKTEKDLYALWKETERAYIDLGLAANLED